MARLMTASPKSPSPSQAPSGTVRASSAFGISMINQQWDPGHEGALDQVRPLCDLYEGLLCEIDSLFRPQRRWLIRTVIDPLNFKFVDNLRPSCSNCSRPLILTRIEPAAPRFD